MFSPGSERVYWKGSPRRTGDFPVMPSAFEGVSGHPLLGLTRDHFSIWLMRWRDHRNNAQRAAGTIGNFHRQGDHVKPPIRKIAEIT